MLGSENTAKSGVQSRDVYFTNKNRVRTATNKQQTTKLYLPNHIVYNIFHLRN